LRSRLLKKKCSRLRCPGQEKRDAIIYKNPVGAKGARAGLSSALVRDRRINRDQEAKLHAKKMKCVTFLMLAIGLGYASISWCFQTGTSVPMAPVSMIVSVEAKHGKDLPTIYKEDVRVFHDHDRLAVVEWVACAGDQAGLELFLLIDDSSSTDVGLQLSDLRKLILGQPAATAVAIGYIRNGAIDVARDFTKDHALAANALRLPLGSAGVMASPYLAVTDLVKRWPQTNNRREILMVSPGIDALQPGSSNSYLDEAIERANRAGVQVYSIYASPAGHLSHSSWRLNWGQSNLSRLADETGAEAYFQGLAMPISYGPYLDEFASRLNHQYRLTFLAKPPREAGFQRIHLETEVPNAELVAADTVYVPAAK
jgi:hypothetical protein